MSAATKKPSKPPASADKLKVTTPGDVEIRIERVFDASRERVWRALTDPKLVAQWWGGGNKLVVEEMDFVAGGRWRYVSYDDRGPHGFFGHYKKITPIERIEQTFAFDGMPGPEGDAVIELVDLGNGKTLLVDRSLVGSKQGVDAILKSGMLVGANLMYEALDRVLAAMS